MKQTVLITGTSSGIGKATAEFFSNEGWNVAATMHAPPKESPFRREILVTRLDVLDRASIEAAVAATIARFGKIDVLVNNAGYGQYGLFEALPREKILKQFEVNVFGVMDVTRAVLAHFRKNRKGTVVNISSGAGIFTLPMISAYCASKFALEGFSEALSFELASQNILVKIVEPHGGVTNTHFSETAAQERADDPSLRDYENFVRHMDEAFTAMRGARRLTADDVAAVVYGAATDGTDRLRYLVGNDNRGFIRARQEMADQDYIDFMRAQLPPR